MRETSAAEIEAMAQSIHETPAAKGYPTYFGDLPDETQLHLRKTAYVFLTGDFAFKGKLSPRETPHD